MEGQKLFQDSVHKADEEARRQMSWRVLPIDTAEVDHVYADITAIANQSRRSDQPFGIDEFPNLNYFAEFIGSGYAVRVNDARGQNVAYGFLTPSHFSRLPKPIYADLRVATTDAQPPVALLSNIQKTMQKIATLMGYVGLIIDTFTTNLDAIQAATENGFRSALVVPLSARLAGQGPRDSMVLLKILKQFSEFPDPEGDATISHLPIARDRPLIGKSAANICPQHMHLPGGSIVTVRNAVHADCPAVVLMMQRAASQGKGYGPWEVPSEAEISMVVEGSAPGQALTFESAASGQIIGNMFVGPSVFCRSASPLLADCIAVVDDRMQSKGIGSLMVSLFMAVAGQSGYAGTLADTFLRNSPMVKINSREGALVVGSLCRGGFIRGKGYSDTVFLYKPTTKKSVQHTFPSSPNASVPSAKL